MLGKSGIEKGSDCLILLRAYDLLGIALDDMANTVKLKRDLCLQIAYNLIDGGDMKLYTERQHTEKQHDNSNRQRKKKKKKTTKEMCKQSWLRVSWFVRKSFLENVRLDFGYRIKGERNETYGAGMMVVEKCTLQETSLMEKIAKPWHWEVHYNIIFRYLHDNFREIILGNNKLSIIISLLKSLWNAPLETNFRDCDLCLWTFSLGASFIIGKHA